MTKIFNDPTNFREDLINGFVAANSRYVKRVPDASGVMALGAPKADKVSVITGGGSGHYPAFCGLVGKGMMDAAVMGEVFASPSSEQVYRVTKALASDAGVIYCYNNYSGDVMNFDMAAMRAEMDGITVKTVLAADDVASAPPESREDRRGIAGSFYVYKCVGASAARGDDIDAVQQVGVHANDRTRSFGVAFDGCTLPGKDEPLFTVEPGKLEVGLGIHGEPGINTIDMLDATGLAKLMVDTVLADAPAGAGSQAAVLLNGLGATKYEELYVLYGEIHRLLNAAGLDLYEPLVQETVTSLNMAGCSLSLFWFDDDLKSLYDAPADCPAFTKIGA